MYWSSARRCNGLEKTDLTDWVLGRETVWRLLSGVYYELAA